MASLVAPKDIEPRDLGDVRRAEVRADFPFGRERLEIQPERVALGRASCFATVDPPGVRIGPTAVEITRAKPSTAPATTGSGQRAACRPAIDTDEGGSRLRSVCDPKPRS